MTVNAGESGQSPSSDRPTFIEGLLAKVARLQEALLICPTDVMTRCKLALLLERLEQYEEALINWNAVLASDPNSLSAREGVARCRRQTGRPLQSNR